MTTTNTRSLAKIGHFLLALGLAIGTISPAGAVELAQTPLFVNISVAPNVMLQFDNSGSMNNIIWDSRYDPATDYENTEPGYFQANIGGGDRLYCPDGAGFASDCIRLPEPGGRNTRYEQNYLDWIVTEYGAGDDLRGGEIPDTSRIQVARQVATQLVNDNPDVNLGLTRFNPPNDGARGPGGTVIAACGAPQQTLRDQISGLQPATNTPLAETYYEISRYFRGLGRSQSDGSGVADNPYTSPIEFRCQRNFVISITDGLPTFDGAFTNSDTDPDAPGPDGQTLPDWDGLDPDTDQEPPYPRFSDGHGNGGEASTLFLDDLAQFGFDTDLRPSGTDAAGGSYEDDNFDPQRLETYTVGFAVDNQMLQDAADNGNGQFFQANDLPELTDALQGALSDIQAQVSIAASLSATSTQASNETQIFRATFNSGTWAGELSAFNFGQTPAFSTPAWNASENLPATDARNIFTLDDSRNGVAFEWDQIGVDGRRMIRGFGDGVINSAFNNGIGFVTSEIGEQILDYIRGNTSEEQGNGGLFRNRDSLLGDIVHSTSAFVGDQNFGYGNLPAPEGSGYSSHLNAKASRQDVVLVGANDGMLHAFNAGDGSEEFAYVPRQVFRELEELAEPGYGQSNNRPHRYYVDGSPAVSDAYLEGSWRTVAVTTLGHGGRGVFALDVTDPGNFNPADDVLWEIDPDSTADGAGDFLGEAMGQPSVVRLENGRWVAIVGNGYNSVANEAALIIIDLRTGEVLRSLTVGAGSGNGLATPAAIDSDRNGSVDTVYVGGLQGNLWKFDVSGDAPSDWGVAYEDAGGNPVPLITATSNGGAAQPITARPDVIAHPRGGVVVVFGTGRYLSDSDTVNTDTQSVYGVWDRDGGFDSDGNALEDEPAGGRSNLVEQTVVRDTSVGDRNVRVLSRNAVNYDDARGWVFDLSRAGERISRDVNIFDGRAILVSTIPDTDPCAFGGDSALIEINPLTGTQFAEPVLDINDDDSFDTLDGIDVNAGNSDEENIEYPGIVDLDVGLATNPYIFTRQDGTGNQDKVITGSSTNAETVGEKGFLRPGRNSWLQLR